MLSIWSLGGCRGLLRGERGEGRGPQTPPAVFVSLVLEQKKINLPWSDGDSVPGMEVLEVWEFCFLATLAS